MECVPLASFLFLRQEEDEEAQAYKDNFIFLFRELRGQHSSLTNREYENLDICHRRLGQLCHAFEVDVHMRFVSRSTSRRPTHLPYTGLYWLSALRYAIARFYGLTNEVQKRHLTIYIGDGHHSSFFCWLHMIASLYGLIEVQKRYMTKCIGDMVISC